MIRNTINTVVAWSNADPDELTKCFHNMLLHEYDWAPGFRRMLDLFGPAMGYAAGRYRHHDGWRCP